MSLQGPVVTFTNAVNLGAYTPATLNIATLPSPQDLGKVFEVGGQQFRIVQFVANSVAGVVGSAAYWYAYDPAAGTYQVTMAHGSSLYGSGVVAGGLLVIPTDQNYICVQVGGRQALVTVDASTAIGGQMSGSATDGVLAHTAAGTASVNPIAAIAETAVSTGTSTVRWVIGATL
jgi:hypothetical protein